MSLRVALFFVPGWTLATGSPHLAIPLLSAFLKAAGIDVGVRDLNFEAANVLNAYVSESTAAEACAPTTLTNMNGAYFQAEDRLMEVAKHFGGNWNAQLGFSYEDSPEKSSKSSLISLGRHSPFDAIFNSVAQDVLSEQPDVIGLGIASVHQIVPALQLSRLLRSNGYSGFIVLGGNTVSRLISEMALPEVFDIIDGLISFQGEIPFLQLCRALESQRSLTGVPQLTWRDSDGLIRHNLAFAPLDPNSTATPDYNELPVGRYWGKNYLSIVAARGCYYGRCSFCAIPYGWGKGGYAGTRSPALTYQDMLTLVDRHGINRFKFVDEALSPNFMRALASRIIAGGVDVEWEGYVRFEPAWYNQHFVDHVARSGFRKGYFGLEIIPSRQRSFLNKKDSPRPDALLSTCNGAGIKPHLFCMFGFPGTGETEAKETVEFLLEHQDEIDTADIFPWTYAKHTNVPGVEPIIRAEQDWSLEFGHASTRAEVLSSEAVQELASRYEEVLWEEVPRFLHPIYRLISPWSGSAVEVRAQNGKELLPLFV